MDYVKVTAKIIFISIVILMTGCDVGTKTKEDSSISKNDIQIPYIYGNLVDTTYSEMDTIVMFNKRLKLIKFNYGTECARPFIVLDSNNTIIAVLSALFIDRAIFTPESDGSEGLNVDECLINGGGSVKELTFFVRELEKVVNYMGEDAEQSIELVHLLLEEMYMVSRKESYQKWPLMKNIIETEAELKDYFDNNTVSYDWDIFERKSEDERHLFKYHRNINNWYNYFKASLDKPNVIIIDRVYGLILFEVVDSKVANPRSFEETRYMNYKTIDAKVFRRTCVDKP